MFKKIGLIIVSINLAFVHMAHAQAQHELNASGGFDLTISSDKDQYHADEPVWIKAILRNISGHAAIVMYSFPEIRYVMDIRVPMPEWSPVKPRAVLTPFGQKQMYPLMAPGHGGPLLPGQVSSNKFEINKLYHMYSPGDYHVTFSRKLPGSRRGDPDISLTSNEITITILK